MSSQFERRLAALEEVLRDRSNEEGPISYAEWQAGITPRAIQARQELDERMQAHESRLQTYSTLSVPDKLTFQRQDLAELGERFANPVQFSDRAPYCLRLDPDMYAYRRRLIEIAIMELEGANEVTVARERMRAIESLSGRGPSGLEEVEFLQRFGVPYREGQTPAIETAVEEPAPHVEALPQPQRVPECDVAGVMEQVLARLRKDRPLEQPARRAPEPHRPPRAPADRMEGFRGRSLNDDTLPYFEPDG